MISNVTRQAQDFIFGRGVPDSEGLGLFISNLSDSDLGDVMSHLCLSTLVTHLDVSYLGTVVSYALRSREYEIFTSISSLDNILKANVHVPDDSEFKISKVFVSHKGVVEYLSKKRALTNVVITGEFDYMHLLNNSVVPLETRDVNKVLPHIIQGIPEYVFTCLSKRTFKDTMSKVIMWRMLTKECASRGYRNTGICYFTYPELLYSSLRKRVDMSMYNSDIPVFEGEVSPLEMSGEYEMTSLSINVTRYSPNKSSGNFFSPSSTSYLGTFYYHEPESQTLLVGGKAIVAETKCRACQYLLAEYWRSPRVFNRDVNRLVSMIDYYLDEPINKLWNKGKLRRNLTYSLSEAKDMLGCSVESNAQVYIGSYLGITSSEDVFDQLLSKLASYLGYELVVLTRMPGEYQVVTEVLDTRDRAKSFSSLRILL